MVKKEKIKKWKIIGGICFFLTILTRSSYGALPDLNYSIYGGKTLSPGEFAITLGMGWPSIYAQFTFPIGSRFDIGFRPHFFYGVPTTEFDIMIGTGFDIPMRIHIWEKTKWDIALKFEPRMFVGWSDDYIPGVKWGLDVWVWGIGFEPGVMVGLKPNQFLNVIFGGGFPFSILIIVPDEESVFDTHVDVDIPFALFGGVELSLNPNISFFSFMKVGPSINNKEVWDCFPNNCHKERATDMDLFFQFYFGFHFLM